MINRKEPYAEAIGHVASSCPAGPNRLDTHRSTVENFPWRGAIG
jgi:hypothetical protein